MKFFKATKYLPIIELVLMGGGHVTPFLTRQISMFALLVVGFAKSAGLEKNASQQWWIATSLTAFFLVYFTGVGVLAGYDWKTITQDATSYAFALLWPTLAVLYSDADSRKKIIHLVKYCGTTVSVFHLILILMLLMESTMAVQYADYLENNDELRFRLYPAMVLKSSIFSALALVVTVAVSEKMDIKTLLVVFINLVSLVMTFTRGFYIATLVSVAYVFLMAAGLRMRLALSAVAPLLIIWGVDEILNLDYFSDRESSNSDRMYQIAATLEYNYSVPELLFGQGFGSLINLAPKSEIFILEYFTKFGLLLTALFILYSSTHLVKNFIWPSKDKHIRAYAAILMLLLSQSLTNSYITNNIGGLLLIITFLHLPALRLGRIHNS